MSPPPARATLAWVRAQRLATQRVTGAAFGAAADAVRAAVCVQSQDAPLARWSLGFRSGQADAAVSGEQAEGQFVRTHILRPTWHYVAPSDLRWVQRLTSDKVLRSMASRRRNLGTDDPAVIAHAERVLGDELSAHPAMTRKELTPLLTTAGPDAGSRAGHLLAHAELLGMITSGPPRRAEHTYVLVDQAIPAHPNDTLDRTAATRLLVRRFFAGHGPATDRDLARWCSLTLTEIRGGLAELGEVLTSVEIDGERFWWDESAVAGEQDAPPALLLPTFDEALLTYARHPYPRRTPTQDRTRMIAEAAGGTVLVRRRDDYADVGVFKRKLTGDTARITVTLEDRLTKAERAGLEAAAQRLAAYTTSSLRLEVAR